MWGGELFVPKIPSYRIVDVASAINKDCKIKVIGIRPGEKLHEEMITQTDAMNTVKFEGYYVILPSAEPGWDIKKFINESNSKKGVMLQEGFSYNSGNNQEFLNVEELKDLITNL